MPIKLTDVEMKYIYLLESLTGVTSLDCVIDEEYNRIIFLVKKGQVGIAVGRNGINIRRLQKILGKNVEIVEYAETMEDLIKNSLFPARVISVRLKKDANNRKIAVVSVPAQEKGLAIGKDGKNIKRARLLAKRYFDIDWVTLE
ncbi:MAG: NusA-like transcription termination signal-binding factor [Thermoprotei archaeon]|nr:NusA-like transcription termination signal-binding factor [Thermoproteales archaeon]RLE75551.1 MAG: NusA-like transcription termination signal-binding factor [Thermoprotei archaeon]